MATRFVQSDSESICAINPDWAALPNDVVDLILKKLILLPDYIRFASVCKDWRYVALEQKEQRIKSSYRGQAPMLCIPYDDSCEYRRKLYSLCEDKIYHYPLSIPIAYHNRKRCCGTSYGWLAFAEDDLAITLLNPLTGAPPIHLPPVMPIPYGYDDECLLFPEFIIYKIILSCDPSVDRQTYVVAVIYDTCQFAAFIGSGEQTWTRISEDFAYVTDIRFIKGKLYAINSHNGLIVIDCPSARLHSISCDGRGVDECSLSVADNSSDISKGSESSLANTLSLYNRDNGEDESSLAQKFSPPDINVSEENDLLLAGSGEEDESSFIHEDEDKSSNSDDVVNEEDELPNNMYDEDNDSVRPEDKGEDKGEVAAMEYLVAEDHSEFYLVSYLIDLEGGDLLQVRRIFLDEDNYGVTVGFKVYKLHKAEWIEIRNLGNVTLFLGDNSAICISSTSFPNCQPNSIYFTDDCFERCPDDPYAADDMGVFDLETGQIGKYYALPASMTYMPPAVWILPTLS